MQRLVLYASTVDAAALLLKLEWLRRPHAAAAQLKHHQNNRDMPQMAFLGPRAQRCTGSGAQRQLLQQLPSDPPQLVPDLLSCSCMEHATSLLLTASIYRCSGCRIPALDLGSTSLGSAGRAGA